MGKFREDIMTISKNIADITEEEWKKICPTYGSGYQYLSGLYCDYCTELYDKNGKLCPNNK